MKKTILLLFLTLRAAAAFAPAFTARLQTHRSLSSLQSTVNKPEQQQDSVAVADERLTQSINQQLEADLPITKKKIVFCLPLEEIGLNDLPKVGGYVGRILRTMTIFARRLCGGFALARSTVSNLLLHAF